MSERVPLCPSQHIIIIPFGMIIVVVVVNLILFNIRKLPIRAVVVVCPLSPIGRLDHLQPLAHVVKSYGDHHIITIMMLVMIDKNSYASN